MKKLVKSVVFDVDSVQKGNLILVRFVGNDSTSDIEFGEVSYATKTTIGYKVVDNSRVVDGCIGINDVESGRIDYTVLSDIEVIGVIATSNGEVEEVDTVEEEENKPVEITLPQLHAHIEQMGTKELGDLLRKVGEVLASRGAKFCVQN